MSFLLLEEEETWPQGHLQVVPVAAGFLRLSPGPCSDLGPCSSGKLQMPDSDQPGTTLYQRMIGIHGKYPRVFSPQYEGQDHFWDVADKFSEMI